MRPEEFVQLVNGIAVLVNVLRVSIDSVKDMLTQVGATDQELNAILAAVESDRSRREAARQAVVDSAKAAE